MAWRQIIIWTNDDLIGDILVEKIFSLNEMYLKMLSAKWRPFGFGLNVLRCENHSVQLYIHD